MAPSCGSCKYGQDDRIHTSCWECGPEHSGFVPDSGARIQELESELAQAKEEIERLRMQLNR
jgi:hypothetical protein